MYNLHNHTSRCNHAGGSDEEYVLEAIKNGYDTIGFSDHAPYIFPQNHHSGFRMRLNETEDYVNSILELKEKYKSLIDIKLGFEVEYYPDLIEKELEYLKSFHYDYIILGQHFTDNEYEPYAKYSGNETKSAAVLDKYIHQVLLAAKSGQFTYIAHPDLINFTGDHDVYLKKMSTMIKALKEYNIPLEFNFLGYTDKRQYPNLDFWKIVAQNGNPVVIGLDAHKTEVYSNKKELDEVHLILKKLNITPLDKIDLINWEK